MMTLSVRYKKHYLLFLVSALMIFNIVLPNELVHAMYDADYNSANEIFFDDDGKAGCAATPSSSSTTAAGSASQSEADFVNKYIGAAYKIGVQEGIPWEIIMAQAVLESGWGTTRLASYNNFHGIKATAAWRAAGKKIITLPTREENAKGESYYIDADWEWFDTPEEGFQGYSDFIHTYAHYDTALSHRNDPIQYLTDIWTAGYATDHQYVTIVTRAMNEVIKILGTRYDTEFIPSSKLVYPNPVRTHSTPSTSSSTFTSSTSTASANCASSSTATPGTPAAPGNGTVQTLLSTIQAYAWVKGTDPQAGSAEQKPAYHQAVADANAKGLHTGGSSVAGNDCAGFVNVTMHASGYETNWPNQGTDGLADAVRKVPGWHQVSHSSSIDSSTSDLQAGDVIMTPAKGHVLFYIGQVSWTSSRFVEAAYHARDPGRAPYTQITSSSFYSSGYVVFRKG